MDALTRKRIIGLVGLPLSICMIFVMVLGAILSTVRFESLYPGGTIWLSLLLGTVLAAVFAALFGPATQPMMPSGGIVAFIGGEMGFVLGFLAAQSAPLTAMLIAIAATVGMFLSFWCFNRGFPDEQCCDLF